jgi:hypothetical protein
MILLLASAFLLQHWIFNIEHFQRGFSHVARVGRVSVYNYGFMDIIKIACWITVSLAGIFIE